MFKLFTQNPHTNSYPIYLFNTATRTKETFSSLHRDTVTMYACGPTVYDHIHIGNLRAYLLPDLLHRLFLYNGYRVKLTINLTDFGHLTDDADAGEDKMMKGMRREGYPITLEAMREFALPYIESFKNDLIAFGNLPATTYSRASDYIREEIALIETLVEKGYTYETSDGVYFDISKFPAYGKLGNIDLEKLRAGARVSVNDEKRHPADFALWKKGLLGWQSRWGTGFPGWHIECTAMAFTTLGKQIDIHTGGEDLMYTHHNGEIAQAECATGKSYVSYWMHNAFITIDDAKLAKSAGNGIRLSELQAKGFSPASYRLWLLQSHYRTTANFTFEALTASKTGLERLMRLVYSELGSVRPGIVDEQYERRFMERMHDDLDTPGAIAILWELVRDERLDPTRKLATIHAIDSVLSLGLSLTPEEGLAQLGFVSADIVDPEVQILLEERELARIAHNWSEADRLRTMIQKHGYTVEDGATGPRLQKILD